MFGSLSPVSSMRNVQCPWEGGRRSGHWKVHGVSGEYASPSHAIVVNESTYSYFLYYVSRGITFSANPSRSVAGAMCCIGTYIWGYGLMRTRRHVHRLVDFMSTLQGIGS
ncbi:hypothetical protein K443DRAFT_654392 [Laccaria amethystina LaAM-08-1]|uniref:Uncharacterized protein n=1 Tax=Laccaria amethystina LaAM-08-1 TaxID=1095629 RepID=A0A0C9WTF1_9AGAR|nr:hypothetical protein K443DRAFT_654392 [Laccaria amethystina LaAM-08-1]